MLLVWYFSVFFLTVSGSIGKKSLVTTNSRRCDRLFCIIFLCILVSGNSLSTSQHCKYLPYISEVKVLRLEYLKSSSSASIHLLASLLLYYLLLPEMTSFLIIIIIMTSFSWLSTYWKLMTAFWLTQSFLPPTQQYLYLVRWTMLRRWSKILKRKVIEVNRYRRSWKFACILNLFSKSREKLNSRRPERDDDTQKDRRQYRRFSHACGRRWNKLGYEVEGKRVKRAR